MAKRYHQTKKDKMKESRGMKKYEARERRDHMDEVRGMRDHFEYERDPRGGRMYSECTHTSAEYARDSRSNSSMRDIKQDKSDIGNLPQRFMRPMVPKAGLNSPMNTMMPDLFDATQDQIDRDTNMLRRMFKPVKI